MHQSTMREIKQMFAKEHVTTIGTLFGTKYYDPKTGKEISKRKAMKFLRGDY